ncbi:MAG: glycerol kinase [Gammaproteobacteria bacterium RIFCSPHIGHO2_12_FULL_41_15]|nr:MAG: glycerol kinase [Gammaproteobacteria bacterium RIFCSPHIGHO2_12_FULL_41_15]
MTKYILAIDQGTTSSRAMLLNQRGTPLQQAQQEFTQHYPGDGEVEHDPEEIWRVTYACCKAVIEKMAIDAKQIATIGITNQRETTLIWDRKTGKPIHNAIVWQDRRTANMCDALRKEPMAQQINAKTGLLLDPYLSATKIKWLLENIPQAEKQAKTGELAFGTIDTFLLWKLTNGKVHATDASNASRTMIFNIHTQKWDNDLLNFFDIPQNLLPSVFDNCHHYGVTDKSLFGVEIPITAMIGDQQGALVGQACFHSGMIKSTYGTGCFLLLNTGDKIIQSRSNLISTVAYRIKGKVTYGLEGSIFNAGTTIKWLRDNLHLIRQASEAERLAQQVKNTNGVYFVPAFTGLGAPYWDPGARGAILGLARDTESAHIVRAALEAVCYQTLDLLQAMQNDGIDPIKLFRVDGGMAVNNWLLQFLANMLEHTVQRPKYVETTAMGAAYLAGLGAGLFSSLKEIEAFWQAEQEFHPKIGADLRHSLYSSWKQAVNRVRSERQPLQ